MSNFNNDNNDFQGFNDGRGANQYGGDFAGNQDPSAFDSTATSYGNQNLGGAGTGQSDWDNTNTTGTGGTMGGGVGGGMSGMGGMGGQNAGWDHSQGTTGASDYTGGGQFQSSGRTAADFGSTGAPHASMGDKVKGTAEKLVGKATKNPELVERGQERATGMQNNQF